jgi:hypothetical protein
LKNGTGKNGTGKKLESVNLPTIIAGGFLVLSFIILYIYKHKKRDH